MDDLLTPYERSIENQLQPFIDQLLRRVDELTAAGSEITDAVLEELTAPLNDAAARVIAAELNALQPAVADKAERWGSTTPKTSCQVSC